MKVACRRVPSYSVSLPGMNLVCHTTRLRVRVQPCSWYQGARTAASGQIRPQHTVWFIIHTMYEYILSCAAVCRRMQGGLITSLARTYDPPTTKRKLCVHAGFRRLWKYLHILSKHYIPHSKGDKISRRRVYSAKVTATRPCTRRFL